MQACKTVGDEGPYLVQQDAEVVACIASKIRVANLCQLTVSRLNFLVCGIIIDLHHGQLKLGFALCPKTLAQRILLPVTHLYLLVKQSPNWAVTATSLS
jgi:hypothetical protein